MDSEEFIQHMLPPSQLCKKYEIRHCNWCDDMDCERNESPAKKDAERYKTACMKISHEVEQILGKALGYPWYKDDQKNFPGATEEDGVCVGEHVAETIAVEAANKIIALKAALGMMKMGFKPADDVSV